MITNFLTLFLRYVAAILTAFITSVIIVSLLAFAATFDQLDAIMPYFQGMILLIAGFCGVFFGSLCLESSNRRFGSLSLLVLGLGYYVYSVMLLNYPGVGNPDHPYHWTIGLVELAIGGLAAMALTFKRKKLHPSR